MRPLSSRLAGSVCLVLLTTLFPGCAHEGHSASGAFTVAPARAEVEAALRQYSALVLAMDYEGLAGLFTADADIGHAGTPPVHGRAAIQSFLAGFSGYQVLEYAIVPASTVVHTGVAYQTGSYRQRVRTPQGQVLEVSGRFEADWRRGPSGLWLIGRMSTSSSP